MLEEMLDLNISPWHIAYSEFMYCYEILDSSNHVIAITIDNEQEDKAAARLMAAAPEMYRLLQNFAYTEEPITTRTLNLSNRARELLRRIDGEEEITPHEGTD